MRYNILCRRVLPDGRGLEECGPNVRFLPRRVGLSNTSVMVADLQSHTNYSFLLEAVNGVSELAKDHAKQYVSLNVTTNQAGMLRRSVTTVNTCFFANHSLPMSSPISTTAVPFFFPHSIQTCSEFPNRNHHHFVMTLFFCSFIETATDQPVCWIPGVNIWV